MANFHLRGLSDGLYQALRARAKRNSRSINAEIVAILEEAAREDVERERLMRDLERLRKRIRLGPGPPIEQIIREARDERSRRL